MFSYPLSRATRRYADAQNQRDPPRHGRVTDFHVNGARYALEIAKIVGAGRAYLKGGGSSCDRQGVTGEVLTRGGIEVIRVG